MKSDILAVLISSVLVLVLGLLAGIGVFGADAPLPGSLLCFLVGGFGLGAYRLLRGIDRRLDRLARGQSQAPGADADPVRPCGQRRS